MGSRARAQVGAVVSWRNTAYHEAAHAVIGYRAGSRFGWSILRVHIIPGGGIEGAYALWAPKPWSPEMWRARFYIAAAGPAASVHLDGSQEGCEGDFEKLDECLQNLPNSEQFYYSRAWQMVRRNWNAIDAVARVLLRRKILNGDELVRVIRRSDRKTARAAAGVQTRRRLATLC